MITRPLDLASKLRPPPRSFDALFFVNAGLIVLFFFVFGSRFVLAPGIAVNFQLPIAPGANANARPTTHHITIVKEGQIFAGDGLRDPRELRVWLKEQAGAVREPTLLIHANQTVPLSVVLEISSSARSAGFQVQIAAGEPSGSGPAVSSK